MIAKKNKRTDVFTRRYVYNFHFHLIWCTKYRNKIFINEELCNEMKNILNDIAKENEIVIENMEIMSDHIHTLISFPPRMSPVSVIKILKGRSAFLFFKKHPEIKKEKCWGGHLWTSSYYMSTLGDMSKEVVENYINNQKYNVTNKKNDSSPD